MRITKLTLTNFRSFKQEQTITFAPITLLFGPNSVGKSSVLMALFYLQQIIEKGQCNPQRLEALGNKLVGGFKNLVNGRDLSKSIVIRIDYDKQGAIGSTYAKSLDLLTESSTLHDVSLLLQDQAVATEQVGLEFVIAWSKLQKTAYVQKLSVWLNNEFICETSCDEGLKNPLITRLNLSHVLLLPSDHDTWLETMLADSEETIWSGWYQPNMALSNSSERFSENGLKSQLHADLKHHKMVGFKAISGALPKPNKLLETTISHEDSVVAAIINEALSEVLVSPLDNLLAILNDSLCIGPLRCIPDSTYQPSQYPRQGDWYDGKACWDALSTPYLMRDAKINEWLADEDKLNLGYQLVYVTRDSETRFIKASLNFERTEDVMAINDAVQGQLMASLSKENLDVNPESEQVPVSMEYLEELRKNNDIYSSFYVGNEIDKTSFVSLWDIRNQIPVTTSDIGVGISQLLPLIVASQDERKGIIACEQPELHIHPRVQVVLGDLLLESCNDKSFLIETHSEHIILRILRRIRESHKDSEAKYDPINPNEISIIYLQSTGEGVITKKLEITDDGDFEHDWPDGFFDERDEELF
ncbi:DUF3696 domain-containing protein [Alishewanella jeotgali]|uniref:AAA domain-containing protein n=1 Tax=Alishewanella jeotgali KCTC 22429 TaxID=1129374 RepID=H3ZFF0_9ALTE|nr:DUF3696 domain-containing protein [Alishewanella jeotgali]EHR40711.1 hypothetical protein AJE_10458 [Alishewanella jeotgali KCTC 22429]